MAERSSTTLVAAFKGIGNFLGGVSGPAGLNKKLSAVKEKIEERDKQLLDKPSLREDKEFMKDYNFLKNDEKNLEKNIEKSKGMGRAAGVMGAMVIVSALLTPVFPLFGFIGMIAFMTVFTALLIANKSSGKYKPTYKDSEPGTTKEKDEKEPSKAKAKEVETTKTAEEAKAKDDLKPKAIEAEKPKLTRSASSPILGAHRGRKQMEDSRAGSSSVGPKIEPGAKLNTDNMNKVGLTTATPEAPAYTSDIPLAQVKVGFNAPELPPLNEGIADKGPNGKPMSFEDNNRRNSQSAEDVRSQFQGVEPKAFGEVNRDAVPNASFDLKPAEVNINIPKPELIPDKQPLDINIANRGSFKEGQATNFEAPKTFEAETSKGNIEPEMPNMEGSKQVFDNLKNMLADLDKEREEQSLEQDRQKQNGITDKAKENLENAANKFKEAAERLQQSAEAMAAKELSKNSLSENAEKINTQAQNVTNDQAKGLIMDGLGKMKKVEGNENKVDQPTKIQKKNKVKERKRGNFGKKSNNKGIEIG